MGRKKRKQVKPWCWYCNRDFEDEKILIHHQKAKHFKCPFCHRKLFTGPGLSIHCNAVHKEKLDKIPNALAHRASTVIDIYGMSGIPEADLLEHEKQKLGQENSEEPPEKNGRLDEVGSAFISPLPAFPFVPPVPGIVPYMPMPPVIPAGVPPFLSAMPPAPPPPPPPPPVEEPPIRPPDAPLKPTFPAYSDVAVAKGPVPKIIRPAAGVSGVAVELIYPEEDLSLEELMAFQPKYQLMLEQALKPPPPPPVTLTPAPLHHTAPGMIPYVPIPHGMPVSTTAVSFIPVPQPTFGVPGYPQSIAQVPPTWMGLPNVRF